LPCASAGGAEAATPSNASAPAKTLWIFLFIELLRGPDRVDRPAEMH
jgi:hypothetical protein